ncbi:hypothetical protein D9M71_822220 [compost metagenome]
MAKLNKNCTVSRRGMSAGNSPKAAVLLLPKARLGASLGNGRISTKASSGSQAR